MPQAITQPPQTTELDAIPGRPFAKLAWMVVAFNLVVILEGAVVRATGSGAGCGNHWPLCNGQLVFGTPALAKTIEYTHRALTVGLATAVLGLLAYAFSAYPKGHAARFGAGMTGLFLLTEAVLGAALVIFGLVVNDASPARAAMLSLHLTNTLALVAFSALTAWWADHPRVRFSQRDWTILAAVAFLGITGVMAALADTLYPVHSLAAGFAQDLSPNATFLVKLRAVHPFVAAMVGLWVMVFALQRIVIAGKIAKTVIALVILQLLAGVLNLALLTPVWMQVLHLLLADLLWISLVLLCAHGEAAETQAA